MEKMLEFSGTKWYTPGREPVIVHDILSDGNPDIRDSDSMEITAMMHNTKDDGDLLNSTSELCLEDDQELSNVQEDLQDYMYEWKGCSKLPGNDSKACEMIDNPTEETSKEEPVKTGESRRQPGLLED